MSRGLPSMTALLGLLAIAGYQNRDKIAEMLGGRGQNKPGADVQAALVVCLANWVSAAPAPEGSSVVGSASLPIALSRAVRAKPRSPESTQAASATSRRKF